MATIIMNLLVHTVVYEGMEARTKTNMAACSRKHASTSTNMECGKMQIITTTKTSSGNNSKNNAAADTSASVGWNNLVEKSVVVIVIAF
jgi:hypothetical protein